LLSCLSFQVRGPLISSKPCSSLLAFPPPPLAIGSSSGEPTTHNVSDSCRGPDYNTQFINRRAKQTLHLLVQLPLRKARRFITSGHDHQAFKNGATDRQRGEESSKSGELGTVESNGEEEIERMGDVPRWPQPDAEPCDNPPHHPVKQRDPKPQVLRHRPSTLRELGSIVAKPLKDAA
jgi:hypothetical protein